MARGKRVAPGTEDDWFVPEDTTPVKHQVVNRQKKPLVARFTKFYLWTAAILFVPMMLSLLVVARQAIQPVDDAPVITYGDQYSAEAQVMMGKWLATTPAPLPGGKIVAYNGSDRTTPTDKENKSVGYTLLVHHFILVDANSALYDATLQTSLTEETGQVMLAQPGLVPIAASDQYASGDQWPWPGTDSTNANDDVKTAIKAWSTAFTSGDAAILKQSVGDPDAAHFYVPITGAKFAEDFSVTDAGAIFLPTQPDNAELPGQMYVRVQFGVTWTSQPSDPNSTYNKATLTYDLLVDKTDTATPVVVGWGTPGQTLTRFGNAITRQAKVVVVTPTTEPTSTPSSTPTGTPSASGTPSGTPSSTPTATGTKK